MKYEGEHSPEIAYQFQLPPSEQSLVFDPNFQAFFPETQLKGAFGIKHLLLAAGAGALIALGAEETRYGNNSLFKPSIPPTLQRLAEARPTPSLTLPPTTPTLTRPTPAPTPQPTERPKPQIEKTPSLDRILTSQILIDWREGMKRAGIEFSLWDYGRDGLLGEIVPGIRLRTRTTPNFTGLVNSNRYAFSLEPGDITSRYEMFTGDGDYVLILFAPPETNDFRPEQRAGDDVLLFAARKMGESPDDEFIRLKDGSKRPNLVTEFR